MEKLEEKNEEIKMSELINRIKMIETFYGEPKLINRIKFYLKYYKEKRKNANNRNH